MEKNTTISFVNLEGCCYCRGTYIINESFRSFSVPQEGISTLSSPSIPSSSSSSSSSPSSTVSSGLSCRYCSTIPLAREEKVDNHILHGDAGSSDDHTGQMLWPGSVALLRYLLYYHKSLTVSSSSSPLPPYPTQRPETRLIPLFQNQSILELGSGCGVISSILYRLFNCKSILITDGAAEAIDRCKRTLTYPWSNSESVSSSLSSPTSTTKKDTYVGGLPFSWTVPIASLTASSTGISSLPNIDQLLSTLSSSSSDSESSSLSFYIPSSSSTLSTESTVPNDRSKVNIFFPIRMIIGAEIIYPSSTFASLLGLFTSVSSLCRIHNETPLLSSSSSVSSPLFLLSYVQRKPETTLKWLYCAYVCQFHTQPYTLIDWRMYSHTEPLLDAQIILFTCPPSSSISSLSSLWIEPLLTNPYSNHHSSVPIEPTIDYLLQQYYQRNDFQLFVKTLFPTVITQIENYLALQKELQEEEWCPPSVPNDE